MKSFRILILAAITIAGIHLADADATAAESTKLNILFIFSDDQMTDCHAFQGSLRRVGIKRRNRVSDQANRPDGLVAKKANFLAFLVDNLS